METYVWCEDRGAGLDFWNVIFKTLNPNAIVETKINNSRLRMAASEIENDGNDYYILIDTTLDNADVLREIDRLKRSIKGKKNVSVINIHSFEFVLLSFQFLEKWIFAEQDALRDHRHNLLQARKMFVELVTHNCKLENLSAFKTLFPYAKTHNSEQIASELLYQITRNTGFETSKGHFGKCFVIDCCQWQDRQSDDLCGLDTVRPASDKKIKMLIDYSVLKAALQGVGL